MTWLVLLLEWLARAFARRRSTFEDMRLGDHLIDTTPRRRRDKWL
jgi:hypothetical protein